MKTLKTSAFFILLIAGLNATNLFGQKNAAVVYSISGKITKDSKALKRSDTIYFKDTGSLVKSLEFKQPGSWMNLYLLSASTIIRIPKSDKVADEHTLLGTRGQFDFALDTNLYRYTSLLWTGAKEITSAKQLKSYFEGAPYYWNWGDDSISVSVPEYPLDANKVLYLHYEYKDKPVKVKISDAKGIVCLDSKTISGNLPGGGNIDFLELKNLQVTYFDGSKEIIVASPVNMVFLQAVIIKMKQLGSTEDQALNNIIAIYFGNTSNLKNDSSYRSFITRIKENIHLIYAKSQAR